MLGVPPEEAVIQMRVQIAAHIFAGDGRDKRPAQPLDQDSAEPQKFSALMVSFRLMGFQRESAPTRKCHQSFLWGVGWLGKHLCPSCEGQKAW